MEKIRLPASPQESGVFGPRRGPGFTKVEALVAVAVILIIAGFAVPGFTTLLPDYYLKAAARDLYSNLQLAKAGAIKNRAEWALRFVPGANSYEVWSSGKNGVWDGYSEPNDTLIKKVTFADYGGACSYGSGGATRKVGKNEPIADTITYPGDRVIFNSRGTTKGTFGGYVYLQNNRNACFAVGTWSTGIVVVRKWNGSAWE